MYCKKCGAKIEDGDRFCVKCGYDSMSDTLEDRRERIDNNDIVFEIKPTFKVLYRIFRILSKYVLRFFYFVFLIYVYIWCSTHNGHLQSTNYLQTSLFQFMILFVIVLLIGIIKLFFEKQQHKSIKYIFYKNKVEYVDGFLNLEQKELKYEYIREITVKQNVLDRMFNIGTINIYSNAVNGYGNGIYIHCVENVQEQYKKIKEIVDNCSNN